MRKFKQLGHVFCALGLFLAGCGKQEQPQKGRPPVPVIMTQAIQQDLPVTLGSVGRCKAYNEVDVVSQIRGGTIIEVCFEEGALVEKDQALFRIDDRKYQAALQSAKAALERNTAQLSIDQVQLERSQSLITKDYISKQEFDTYEARVKQDQASIEAAKAAVTQAEVDLEHCTIRAPFKGLAGKRLVDLGAVVNELQKVVSVRQMSPLSVEFFIPENHFPELHQRFKENQNQLKFDVTLISESSVQASGTLKFLDNQIDSESGVIHLKGDFDNQDFQFWPGNTVRLQLHLDMLKNATLIPSACLRINKDGKPYVYVIKEDAQSATKYRAALIYPDVGYQNEQWAQIRQGIAVGDRVILHGNMLLGDGADVIPTPER